MTNQLSSEVSDFEADGQSKAHLGREILGVIAGAITDLVCMTAIIIILWIVVLFSETNQLISQGLSSRQVLFLSLSEVNTLIKSNVMVIIELLVFIFGGFVAGKIAKQNEVINGLGAGVLASAIPLACLSVFMILSSPAVTLTNLFLGMRFIAVSGLGGYLAYLLRVRSLKKI